MLSTEITQLKLALDLAHQVVPKALTVPEASRSPYQKVIIGFVDMATKHAEALKWAIENGNLPACWSALRVLTEMIFSLDYINEEPQFQAYRSCLLLLEAPERGARLLTSEHSPMSDPAHPRHAAMLKVYEDEKQALLSLLDTFQRGPNDPERWATRKKVQGISAKKRAIAGNWEAHYDFLYEVGSAFVHADGYALSQLERFSVREAHHMAEQGGILLTAIVVDLVQAYPEIEEDPAVDTAWKAYCAAFNGR